MQTEETKQVDAQEEKPSGVVMSIGGAQYTIGPCRALPGLLAVTVLAKHIRGLIPAVRDITGKVESSENVGWEEGLATLESIQPTLEAMGADLFRILHHLTGITQQVLEDASLAEFWAVLKAVGQVNALGLLVSQAAEIAQESDNAS